MENPSLEMISLLNMGILLRHPVARFDRQVLSFNIGSTMVLQTTKKNRLSGKYDAWLVGWLVGGWVGWLVGGWVGWWVGGLVGGLVGGWVGW